MDAIKLQESYNSALYAYKLELTAFLLRQWGPTIRYGPMKGITIPHTDVYGAAKVLGLYESELHSLFETCMTHMSPDMFVNVGCGEGYYCFGAAKMLPVATPIVGVDISEDCLKSAVYNAAANDMSGRIRFKQESTPVTLEAELRAASKPMVWMDCEGAEQELLDPVAVPSLKKATILVEIHPFNVADIRQSLQVRFGSTHHITTIRQGARNVHLPELSLIHENDKYLLCSEGRPQTMEWLFMVPLANPMIECGGAANFHVVHGYYNTFWNPVGSF